MFYFRKSQFVNDSGASKWGPCSKQGASWRAWYVYEKNIWNTSDSQPSFEKLCCVGKINVIFDREVSSCICYSLLKGAPIIVQNILVPNWPRTLGGVADVFRITICKNEEPKMRFCFCRDDTNVRSETLLGFFGIKENSKPLNRSHL